MAAENRLISARQVEGVREVPNSYRRNVKESQRKTSEGEDAGSGFYRRLVWRASLLPTTLIVPVD